MQSGTGNNKNAARSSKVRFAMDEAVEEEQSMNQNNFADVQAKLAMIAGGGSEQKMDIEASINSKKSGALMHMQEDDDEYEASTNQHLETKYKMLLDKYSEQDKTVQFQKAKIAAL